MEAKVFEYEGDLILANEKGEAVKMFDDSCCWRVRESEVDEITDFDSYKEETGISIAARIAVVDSEERKLPTYIYRS